MVQQTPEEPKQVPVVVEEIKNSLLKQQSRGVTEPHPPDTDVDEKFERALRLPSWPTGVDRARTLQDIAVFRQASRTGPGGLGESVAVMLQNDQGQERITQVIRELADPSLRDSVCAALMHKSAGRGILVTLAEPSRDLSREALGSILKALTAYPRTSLSAAEGALVEKAVYSLSRRYFNP